MIKVASPCNSNYEMLEWLCDNYSGEIHVSLGMTSKEDIDKIVKFFINKIEQKIYIYILALLVILYNMKICVY